MAAATSFTALKRVAPADVQALNLDPIDDVTRKQAIGIVDAVRAGGEAALLDFAHKFKDLPEGEAHIKTSADLKSAFDSLPTATQELLTRVHARVAAFATAQRASITPMDMPVLGGSAGHTVAPVATAGCYAPGGRYPLPSSVIMTAATARAAGVANVWVASPRPDAVTLGAAHVAGADGLLAVGGAQAIAALAYGIGGVPRADVIVGPGNRWVTAAKAYVAGSGVCAIDMIAGPSECLVLADETADASMVAADLLAQAEHDTDALPVLVTTHAPLAEAVDAALREQLATLPTAETAAVAASKGLAVIAASLEEAISVCDLVAPEHLEVFTKDAQGVAARLSNYGALFVGQNAAEVFGDYGVGPNHVLPTSGTARFTGGLSVFTFLRVRTHIVASESPSDADALAQIVADSAALAELEGLIGHQRAALARGSTK